MGRPGPAMSLIPEHPHDTQSVTPEELSDTPPFSAAGTLVGGRYRVEGVLGRGGYAVVYRAVDEASGESVALKVLRADRASAVAVRRLQREAESAGAVRHPNVVRVLDHGVAAEGAFLAMELVAGETLRERIARGALPVDEAVRVASGIGAALEALHEMGLVHRDLKPSNVLLGADGSVRVADLGLVTALDPEDETRATRADGLVGTLEYLSPEQALGQEVDGRSDLYSLGVLLFEMLAGQLPFTAKTSLGSALARVTAEPARLSDLQPAAPAWLVAVVQRLLEKEPERRYGSAAELIADLQRQTPPPQSEPTGPTRNRKWFALSLLALGVAAGAVVAWQRRPPATPASLTAVEFVGSSLRGIGSDGRVAWSRRLPAAARSSVDVTRASGLADLDGDGAFEAWAVPETGEVAVFGSDGALRFTHKPAMDSVRFGNTVYARPFLSFLAKSLSSSHGPDRLWVVSTHNIWFPSSLEQVDAAGRVLSRYWSNGFIDDVASVEVDGHKLIAVAAAHNETRGASLALLDAGRATGAAPAARYEYRCTSCPAGEPLAFLVFPAGDVHLEGVGAGGSTLGANRVQQAGETLRLAVLHRRASPGLNAPMPEANVTYLLDTRTLRLLDVWADEAYKSWHRALERDGRLHHSFGERDLEVLRRVMRWDGHRFVPLGNGVAPLDSR